MTPSTGEFWGWAGGWRWEGPGERWGVGVGRFDWASPSFLWFAFCFVLLLFFYLSSNWFLPPKRKEIKTTRRISVASIFFLIKKTNENKKHKQNNTTKNDVGDDGASSLRHRLGVRFFAFRYLLVKTISMKINQNQRQDQKRSGDGPDKKKTSKTR